MSRLKTPWEDSPKAQAHDGHGGHLQPSLQRADDCGQLMDVSTFQALLGLSGFSLESGEGWA